MKKFYVYKFVDVNQEILYIGATENLERRINYQHLQLEVKGNLDKKCIEEKCKVYFHTCLSNSEMKIKEHYLIAKLNPKYNKNYKTRDEIGFEMPIKWEEFKFSNYQKRKALKRKDIKNFTLNLNETNYYKLINIYRNYQLKNKLFNAFTLTQFLEIGILYYADFLKNNTKYLKVTDSFKKLILKPGRRPFREVIKERKISSNISLDLIVYNTFLDITYSHVINYDTYYSENYSLSFMTVKLVDFLENDKNSFFKRD